MTDFDNKYDEWRARVIEKFESDYPALSKFRCEVGENGTVYVYARGAYPLEFKGYEKFDL